MVTLHPMTAPTAQGLPVDEVGTRHELISTRRRDRTLERDLCAEWNVPYWLVNPAERTITRHGDSALSINESLIFQS